MFSRELFLGPDLINNSWATKPPPRQPRQITKAPFLFLSATTILYEEEDYVVFNDYRPAAEFHILIIPKKHYRSIQHLKKSDVKMIKEMAEIGYKILEDKSSFSKDNTNELL